MRRLISLLMAAILVAAPLATVGVAVAGDKHGGGGGGGREQGGGRGDQGGGRSEGRGGEGGRWMGGGRGAPAPQPVQRGGEFRGGGDYRGGGDIRRGGDNRGGPRLERVDPHSDPRAYSRGEPPRGDYSAEPRRADPRYDPRAYGPPPGAYSTAPRRGGYLPPMSGEAVQDYGRLRLRPPPRGYAWVRTSGGYALQSTMTGQVFDVVPY
jgi:Ni/Co efflux regulator RcnB